MDMKLIGESTRLAFAALCIGGTFTMDAADAVQSRPVFTVRPDRGSALRHVPSHKD